MSAILVTAFPQKAAGLFLNPEANADYRYDGNDRVVSFHAAHCIAAHGDCTIAFSGRIYEWPELQELHDTHKITRALTASYRTRGWDFLKHLNADFSLVLFDRRENKIIAARDHMGVRPLYVYAHAGIFAFANDISVFKNMGFSLSANEDAVGRFFVFKYSPGEETLYREVKKLKPGTALEVDLTTGAATSHKYWHVFENLPLYSGSFADACAELRHLMQKATTRRVTPDKPLANFLSGGLDSSVLAHYLKGSDTWHYCAVKQSHDLKAEGTTSDGYYAQKLAAEWNLPLEEVSIGAQHFSDAHIRNAVATTSDLIADGSVIPALLMAGRAAQKCTAVWSGMGADEIFLGYNGHYLLRLSQMAGRFPFLQPALTAVLRRISAGRGPLKAYRRYLQKWGNNAGKPFEAVRYSMVGDVDSAMQITRLSTDFESFLAPYFPKDRDIFESLFEFELENFLNKNLSYLYVSGLGFGLEARVPFLDIEVVRFAASLPVAYKMDGFLTSKKVLKRAYSANLPSYITRRRKAGFGMPLRSLLSHPQALETLLPADYYVGHSYFNPAAIRTIIDLHRSGRQDHSALIYALICFRIWELD